MISEREWEQRYESLLAENRKLSEENDRWLTAAARAEAIFSGTVPDGEVEVYREWRVTGDLVGPGWDDKPPYDFTWSARINPHLAASNAEAEAKARVFASIPRDGMKNVHMHSRTVVITEWADEGAVDTPG